MKKIFCLLTSAMMFISCFNLFSVEVSAQANINDKTVKDTSIIKIANTPTTNANDDLTDMYYDPKNEIIFMYDESNNKVLLSYAIDVYNNEIDNSMLFNESGNFTQVIKYIDALKYRSSEPDVSDFTEHFSKKTVQSRKKIVILQDLIDLGTNKIYAALAVYLFYKASATAGVLVYPFTFMLTEISNYIFGWHKEDYYYVDEVVFKNNTCPSYLIGNAKYIDYKDYYEVTAFKTTWGENPSLSYMTTACKAEANVFPYRNY